MSLSREDLFPLLTTAVAAALGVALSAALIDSAVPPAKQDVEVRLEFTYDSDDHEALLAARRAAWASSLESVRDLIEEADALREQQRRISREVTRLYEADAASRVAGARELRDDKELMIAGVQRLREDLERARAEGGAGMARFHAENMAVIRQALVDRIEDSWGTVPVGDRERALALEASIERDLSELVEQVGGPDR